MLTGFKLDDDDDDTILQSVCDSSSGNRQRLEEISELVNQFTVLHTLLNEKNLDGLTESMFIQIDSTFDKISYLPDDFIETMPIIDLLITLYSQVNHFQIQYYSLLFISKAITKSKLALKKWIQSNPTDVLLSYLNPELIPSSERERDFLIVVLNIISKMAIFPTNPFFECSVPILFQFTKSMYDFLQGPVSYKIPKNNTIFGLCFKIFKKLINHSEQTALIPLLNDFFMLSHIVVNNFIYQKYSIMILYHIVRKGFVDEVLKSQAYQECIQLFNDIEYKKSYEFVIMLFVKILTVIDEGIKVGQFDNNIDLSQLFPLPLIIEKFVLVDDNEKIGFFPLFSKIAEIGLINILLDENISRLSSYFFLFFEEEHSYQVKTYVFRLLWIGVFNLRSLEEKLAFMNADLFVALVNVPDIQDDIDLFKSIFAFLTECFHAMPYNSQFLEESIGLCKEQLKPTAQNGIDFFVENCLNDENEDVHQLAVDYIESIQPKAQC